MDAPAALKTIATGKLAFTDPGSIYLDGKNVLSLVVEVDAALLGGVGLVGVVAETLTRGTFNVRIERVGRPEVKNMMLAMKQFDPVNRDLEIRDLYNMEDGFQLGEAYRGAYRARLNANLAFWDGIDGKTDWVARRERRPPVDESRARRLPGGRPHEAVRGARLLPGDRARRAQRRGPSDLRRADPQRRCDGHDLHPADQRRQRADHPRWRRPVDATRLAHLPLPVPAEPGPARTPRAPLDDEPQVSSERRADVVLELDDIQSGALHERPSPYVGTYLLLRIDDRAAGRELVRRLHPVVDYGSPSAGSRQATPGSRSPSPIRV